MLKLAKDNPSCIMYPPNKLIPYPGGKAFSEAVKLGYKAPITPNDWINLDQDGEVYQPWYTPEKNRYMRILQISAYGLSNWEVFLKNRPGWLQLFFKVSKFFYKPIAKLRLKYSITSFFIEYPVLKIVKAILVRLSPAKST